jgi:thiol-disulfide isomerase/thioredoxin
MYWKNPKLLAALVLLVCAIVAIRAIDEPAPVASSSDDSSVPFHILPAAQQTEVDDFTLTPVNGKAFKLSDAVKNGPVVLDFWATYCGPCRMELPVLDTVRARYQSKGIQFYAVNASDDPLTIKAYAAESGLIIPMLTDTNGDISRSLGISVIPVTLVIDGRRKIVSAEIGYDEAMNDDLPTALDKVLQGNI